MCRAEITQEDCTKVKETVSTIAHRREVEFKKREKEKETMERQQLKKKQLERQARLKQEKEERDKREEAHVLGLAGVAQRQAEEVAQMEQLKKDQAAARIVLQKKQNQEKAEKNKLLKAKKAKKKEALRQEKLKANAKTLESNKPVELEPEPRQRKKKNKKPREKDRRPKRQAKRQLQEERRKNKKKEWWLELGKQTVVRCLAVVFIVVAFIGMLGFMLGFTGINRLEWDLYDASFSGHVKTVKRILKEHTTSTFDINRRFERGLFTPLMAACQENHLEVVKLLLRVDSVDVNIPDSLGW